jgi:type VI secretion system protein ImpB
MESLGPKIEITVPNKLGGEEPMNLNLKFNKIKDFHPEELAKNIPELEKILNAREKLNDLLAKLEGNEKLNDMLAELVFNTEINEKAMSEQKKSTSNSKENSEQE